jgi:rubredoxin
MREFIEHGLNQNRRKFLSKLSLGIGGLALGSLMVPGLFDGKDEYKANITCPKCGVDNSLTIDLGKMDNKPFDFEKYPKGTNEFEFTLPVSKRVVTFKLLTKKDEDAIDADLKALTKISKEVTSEITTRLKSYIIALDGNADKSAIRKFVDEMRAGDSLALRNYVRTMTPDVDMSFDFVCSSCGVERREDVPLSVSFFWPNG